MLLPPWSHTVRFDTVHYFWLGCASRPTRGTPQDANERFQISELANRTVRLRPPSDVDATSFPLSVTQSRRKDTDIRAYQIYLTNERKLATGSVLIAVAALRFLYKVSLKKEWTFEDVIPAPKKPQKLPLIPSPEEVVHFLGCVQSTRNRAALTSCYAAGLRITECLHLKAADIDSQRMVIRIDQGKGHKDCYVMLSPKLLETLRSCWKAARPKVWLFESDIAGQPINRSTVELACQKACQLPGNRKPITPHSLRHYTASQTMPPKAPGAFVLRGFCLIVCGIVRAAG